MTESEREIVETVDYWMRAISLMWRTEPLTDGIWPQSLSV